MQNKKSAKLKTQNAKQQFKTKNKAKNKKITNLEYFEFYTVILRFTF
jgi:hypothetical protein